MGSWTTLAESEGVVSRGKDITDTFVGRRKNVKRGGGGDVKEKEEEEEEEEEFTWEEEVVVVVMMKEEFMRNRRRKNVTEAGRIRCVFALQPGLSWLSTGQL
jgi:hypothetical protein